ncbi:hypothetical protein GCM10022627_02680 [Haloarcula argentinensis]
MANRVPTDSGCTARQQCRVFVAQSSLRFRWAIDAGESLTVVRAMASDSLVADYLIYTVHKIRKGVISHCVAGQKGNK